jgi:hypothetical protein
LLMAISAATAAVWLDGLVRWLPLVIAAPVLLWAWSRPDA